VKVCILHQHFKIPRHGGAIRSYYLARALAERGITTVVITAHNGSVHKTENVEGIEVHYLPVAYDNRFGFYRRIRSFFAFVFKAVGYAAHHRDADLCYAISVPLMTGVAALWIQRKYKIPFIFEVGDLWPDAPIQMGFLRNPLLQRISYALERRIYGKATSLVALSPAIRETMASRAPGKVVHLIPNMADTGFFHPEQKKPLLEEKFDVKDKFVVACIGAIGVANGLDYYLACAAECQSAALPIHFLLCGDGAMLDGLMMSAENLHLKNLSFLSFRNRDGVAEIMNVTDAVFICYQPVSILETGSPNKYFDGLAAGKLVVVNFGGWIRTEIEREGCGVYTDAKKSSEFVKAINPFLNGSPLLLQYQRAARSLAEKKYSRPMLSEKFAAIVKSAIAPQRSPATAGD
jgi:glycosyltransferase involved in cell wall biosynthesis